MILFEFGLCKKKQRFLYKCYACCYIHELLADKNNTGSSSVSQIIMNNKYKCSYYNTVTNDIVQCSPKLPAKLLTEITS